MPICIRDLAHARARVKFGSLRKKREMQKTEREREREGRGRGAGNLYFIKIILFARLNERQSRAYRLRRRVPRSLAGDCKGGGTGGGAGEGGTEGKAGPLRARIHINPLCREITLRRKDDSIYARNRLGPRVNAMISLTGYACLRKSISAGKPRTSPAVGWTAPNGPEEGPLTWNCERNAMGGTSSLGALLFPLSLSLSCARDIRETRIRRDGSRFLILSANRASISGIPGSPRERFGVPMDLSEKNRESDERLAVGRDRLLPPLPSPSTARRLIT